MATRVRQDVNKLPQWDPTLLWYAKAVADMQTRPFNDPTSWRYQAAIHGYQRDQDPFASDSDTLPSAADQRAFWSQCQHSSWFFLPWHRMYLLCFEAIVAATVVKLGGPAGWSLPYWNYSDTSNPNARRLPMAFFLPTLPDGSPNALNVSARAPNDNGDIGMTPAEVDIRCLADALFTGIADGGHPGFGGPKTGFNHGNGPTGALEKTPHGDVHVAVGGDSGLMSAFETAALDPIFWLHHANIDRLWQVWLNRLASHKNPADTAWLSAGNAKFQFHDANGQVQTYMPSQMLDTTNPLLGYQYEDTSDPLATGAAVSPHAAVGGPMGAVVQQPAELAGGTSAAHALANAPTTAQVPLQAGAASVRGAALTSAPVTRVYLNLENITGSGRPGGYGVYLNAADSANPPAQSDPCFAGTLPMFGVQAASGSDLLHQGSGLTYVLDVTSVVEHLKAAGTWDAHNLRVTFAPLRAGQSAPDLQVGRISLYYGD